MRIETFADTATAVSDASVNMLASYRAALWLALLTYPWASSMIFRSAKLSSVSPTLAVICFLLSFAWSIAGPIFGWLSLCEADRIGLDRLEHPQVAKEAILAVISAPFCTFSGVALGWLHLAKYQVEFWYFVVAVVALSRWLPKPAAPSVAGKTLKRVHRISAVMLIVFGFAHVFNHIAAVHSLQAHVAFQNVLRKVYRQRIIEILLGLATLGQIWSGGILIMRARLQHSTRLRNLMVLAGAFIGMFYISHMTGVFIGGRWTQHVDTTFAWATGGPRGLLGSPRSPQFFPYYLMGVFALFVHAACAGRWTLAQAIGQSTALKLYYVMIALGAIVTLLLMLPMTGFHMAT